MHFAIMSLHLLGAIPIVRLGALAENWRGCRYKRRSHSVILSSSRGEGLEAEAFMAGWGAQMPNLKLVECLAS
jgi:hypothetical protein